MNNIKFFRLKIIRNPKGDILKYINKKTKKFTQFGEIYFSEIKYGNVKGWNMHKKFFSILTVPFGDVTFTFSDYKFKKKKRIRINKKNFGYIFLPPKNWFSFKSNVKISIVSNILNKIHDDKEIIKKNIL